MLRGDTIPQGVKSYKALEGLLAGREGTAGQPSCVQVPTTFMCCCRGCRASYVQCSGFSHYSLNELLPDCRASCLQGIGCKTLQAEELLPCLQGVRFSGFKMQNLAS